MQAKTEEVKLAEIDKRIAKLQRQQKFIQAGAWLILGAGFLPVLYVFGGYSSVLFNAPDELNQLGTFFGGTSGVMWALAGVLFVYVGLIGQKTEIAQQQIELILTRQQMMESTRALESQELALREQKTEMEIQNRSLRDAWIFQSVKENILLIRSEWDKNYDGRQSNGAVLSEFFWQISNLFVESKILFMASKTSSYCRDIRFMTALNNYYLLVQTTRDEMLRMKGDHASYTHLMSYFHWAILESIPDKVDVYFEQLGHFFDQRTDDLPAPQLVVTYKLMKIFHEIQLERNKPDIAFATE